MNPISTLVFACKLPLTTNEHSTVGVTSVHARIVERGAPQPGRDRTRDSGVSWIALGNLQLGHSRDSAACLLPKKAP